MSMDTALLKRLRDMIGSDDPSTAGLEGVRSEDVADALERLTPEEGAAVLTVLDDVLAS